MVETICKELKMIKLKDLLKESYVWERKFGEKLPTLADVQEKYENKVNEELQQLNEIETYEYNQEFIYNDKFPKIFFDQFKRIKQQDFMNLQDSREFTKILHKYMKMASLLAGKFGNDIKKIKK